MFAKGKASRVPGGREPWTWGWEYLRGRDVYSAPCSVPERLDLRWEVIARWLWRLALSSGQGCGQKAYGLQGRTRQGQLEVPSKKQSWADGRRSPAQGSKRGDTAMELPGVTARQLTALPHFSRTRNLVQSSRRKGSSPTND